ncbi:hypothetical protein [Natrialba sp. INN-245]|uniref:hypothetical protein n=1 Tax=Natrialba sp. INN-245 TaxID=2690967 RepID=UPI00190F48DB|nr:hypothetical protein [Natrialba sp. INN-245]
MSSRCERSNRVVDSLISDFDAEYGEFEVVEKTWTHSSTTCQKFVARYEDTVLGGAGV